MPSGTTGVCSSSICADRTGIMQIVFSPEVAGTDLCEKAASLRAEYCIAVRGEVKKRLTGTENPNIENREHRSHGQRMTVLSESDSLPSPSPTRPWSRARRPQAQTTWLRICGSNTGIWTSASFHAGQPDLTHRIFQCVREFLDSRAL